jgi:pSer/pThr/pTyr-binding forkhead associated (FHA) protein
MSSRPSKPAPATPSGGGTVFHASLVPIGQHAGQPAFALYRPVIVVGSGKKPHILLNDPTVSHSHTVIIQTRSGVYFRDLSSRTHTILNAKSQREAFLRTGDTLTIGSYSFLFNTTQPADLAAPRADAGALAVAGEPFPSPIDDRTVLIGNRRGCEIRISDDDVSTVHALVFELDGKRFLRDLNSRTGTFLNGNAIHQAELQFGDEIRIGKSTIRYVPDEVPQALDEAPLESEPPRIAPLIPATLLEEPIEPVDRTAIRVTGDAALEAPAEEGVEGLKLLPVDRDADPLGLDEPTTVPLVRDEPVEAVEAAAESTHEAATPPTDEEPVIPIGRRGSLLDAIAETPTDTVDAPVDDIEEPVDVVEEPIDVAEESPVPLVADEVESEPVEADAAADVDAVEPEAPLVAGEPERIAVVDEAPHVVDEPPLLIEEAPRVIEDEAPRLVEAPAQLTAIEVETVELAEAPVEPIDETPLAVEPEPIAETPGEPVAQAEVAAVVESLAPAAEAHVADVVESVVEAKQAEAEQLVPSVVNEPAQAVDEVIEPLPILPSVTPEIDAAVNLPPPTETDVPSQRLQNDASRRARLLYELLEQTEVIEEEAEKEAEAIAQEIAALPVPPAPDLSTPVTIEPSEPRSEAPASPSFDVSPAAELPAIEPVTDAAAPIIPFEVDEPRAQERLPDTIDFAAPPVDELPPVAPLSHADEFASFALDLGPALPVETSATRDAVEPIEPVSLPTEPARAPVDEIVEPMTELAPEPITDLAPEPVAEFVTEPVAEVAPPAELAVAVEQPLPPADELAPDPIAEFAAEPIEELTSPIDELVAPDDVSDAPVGIAEATIEVAESPAEIAQAPSGVVAEAIEQAAIDEAPALPLASADDVIELDAVVDAEAIPEPVETAEPMPAFSSEPLAEAPSEALESLDVAGRIGPDYEVDEEPVAEVDEAPALRLVPADEVLIDEVPVADQSVEVAPLIEPIAPEVVAEMVDEAPAEEATVAETVDESEAPAGITMLDVVEAESVETVSDLPLAEPPAQFVATVDQAALDATADLVFEDADDESVIDSELADSSPASFAAQPLDPHARPLIAVDEHLHDAEDDSEAESIVAEYLETTTAPDEPLAATEPGSLLVDVPIDVIEATQPAVESSPEVVSAHTLEVVDNAAVIEAPLSDESAALPVVALDVPVEESSLDAVAELTEAEAPLASPVAETFAPVESTHDEPAEIAAALDVPVDVVEQIVVEAAPVESVLDVVTDADTVEVSHASIEIAETSDDPVLVEAADDSTESSAVIVAPSLDLPVPDLDTFDLPPVDTATPASDIASDLSFGDEFDTSRALPEPTSTAREPIVVQTEPPRISDATRDAVSEAAQPPKPTSRPAFDASILDAWDTDELGRPISEAPARPVAPQPRPDAPRKAPMFDASILDTWDVDPKTSSLDADSPQASATPAARSPEPVGGDGFLNLGGIGWIGLPELDEFERDPGTPATNDTGEPRPASRQTPSMLPPLSGHRRRRRPVKPAEPVAEAPRAETPKPVEAVKPFEPVRPASESAPVVPTIDLPIPPPSDVPVRKLRGPRQRKADEPAVVDDATAEDSPVVASPFAETEVPLVDVFGQAPRAGLDEVLAKLNANPANADVAEELKNLLDQPPNGSPASDPMKGTVTVNGASPFAAGEAPINAAVPPGVDVPPPPTRRRAPRSLATLLFISTLVSGTLASYFYFNTKVEDQVVGQIAFQRASGEPISSDQFRILREQVNVQLGDEVPVRAGQFIGETMPHAWETSATSLQNAWNPDQTVYGGRLRRVSSPYTREADAARMNAVLRALYEVNQPRQVEVKKLRDQLAQADRELEKLKEQERDLRAQIGELTARASSRRDLTRETTEASRQRADAQQRLDNLLAEKDGVAAELERLKGEVAGIGGSEAVAVEKVADDTQLKQLEEQLDSAKKQLDDLTVARTDDSKKARADFDEAIQTFAKEVEDARKNLADRPQFLATVESARVVADQVRDLTDKLVRRQEQQLTDMADLKRQLAELAGSQEEKRYANDEQLQALNDQVQILERQLSVARNDGNAESIADIEQQISTLKTSIAARKDLLDDPQIRGVATKLEEMIDRRQKDMAADRAENEKLLASLQKDFLDRLGAIEQMPSDQQRAARQLTDKLAAVAFARQNYASAVEKQADVPAEQLASVKRQVESLTRLVDARRTELAAADQEASQLAARRAELQRRITTSLTNLKRFEEQDIPQAREAVETALARIKSLEAQQTSSSDIATQLSAATAQLEALVPAVGTIGQGKIADASSRRQKLARDLDDVMVMIEPLAAVVDQGADNRKAYAFGAGAGSFLLLLAASVIVRRREERELENDSIQSVLNAADVSDLTPLPTSTRPARSSYPAGATAQA